MRDIYGFRRLESLGWNHVMGSLSMNLPLPSTGQETPFIKPLQALYIDDWIPADLFASIGYHYRDMGGIQHLAVLHGGTGYLSTRREIFKILRESGSNLKSFTFGGWGWGESVRHVQASELL
jgi:hypothetical protein